MQQAQSMSSAASLPPAKRNAVERSSSSGSRGGLSRSTFPAAELHDTARLILDMLWLQAAHVFRTVRLHVSKLIRRRRDAVTEGNKEPAVERDLRDVLTQSSKYAVLSALHMSRCPTCRSEALATAEAATAGEPQTRHTGSSPVTSQEVVAPAELTRIATCLVMYYREAFVLGLVEQDADASASNDELLGVALKALPGCFVADDGRDDGDGGGDLTFLRILCPHLLSRQSWEADKLNGFARCQDEWSRATMPQLAVSMSVTQFALLTRDKHVLQRCLQRWASRWRTRLSKQRREGGGTEEADGGINLAGGSAAVLQANRRGAPKQVSFREPLRDVVRASMTSAPPRQTTPTPVAAAGAALTNISSSAVAPNGVTHSFASPALNERHTGDLATQRKYFHRWYTVACDAYVKEDRRRHSAFLAASIEAMRRRRRIRRLRRAEQQKLLRAAFELWRDVFVRLERCERRLTAATRMRTLGSVFARWRAAWVAEESARRHSQCQSKLNLLCSAKVLERSRQLLLWWRQQLLVVRFQREFYARKCFRQWCRSLRLVAHLRSCCSAVPGLGMRGASGFHELLLYPSAAAALCDDHRAKCASWRRWVRAWNSRRAERVYVAKNFAHWLRKVSDAARLRTAEVAVRSQRQKRQLHAALRCWYLAWSVTLPLCLEASHVAGQFRSRVLLSRWRQRASRRVHRRTTLQTLRQDKEASLRAALWHRWRSRATLHRSFRETRRMRRQNLLASAMFRWSQRLWLIGILREESDRLADEHCSRSRTQMAWSRWRMRWRMAELERVHRAEQVAVDLADRTARYWMLRRCLALWVGKWAARRLSSSVEPAADNLTRGNLHEARSVPSEHHPVAPVPLDAHSEFRHYHSSRVPGTTRRDSAPTATAAPGLADSLSGNPVTSLLDFSTDSDGRALHTRYDVRHRHAPMPIAAARAHLFAESSSLRKGGGANLFGHHPSAHAAPLRWNFARHDNLGDGGCAGGYASAAAAASMISTSAMETSMTPSSVYQPRTVPGEHPWEDSLDQQQESDIEIEMVTDD